MATHSVEERLAVLEAEFAQLKTQLIRQKPETSVPWWQQIAGVFKDDPMFDEAMRLGREWRESQRPDDDEDKTDRAENAHGTA